jgi:hypothetical protein
MRSVAAWTWAGLLAGGVGAAEWEHAADQAVVVAAPQVLTTSPYAAATEADRAPSLTAPPAWRPRQSTAAPIGTGVTPAASALPSGVGREVSATASSLGSPTKVAPPTGIAGSPVPSYLVPRASAAPVDTRPLLGYPSHGTFVTPPTRVPGAGPAYPPPVTVYRPVVPPPPGELELGRGVWGQPVLFRPGQPIRNFFRSLTP